MNPLALGAMTTTFSFGWLLVALVALVFLVRIYLRTRLSGFLWLLFAVVVLPLVSRLITIFLPILFATRHDTVTGVAEFSIVLGGTLSLLNAILLVVAVALLDRQLAARMPIPALATTQGLPPYRV